MNTNPIRVLLVSVAAGRPPKPGAVDSLPLAADTAPQVRAEVARTAGVIRELRLIGHYQAAHRLAVVAAADMKRHVDTTQAQP